jgi:hypothetical protein
LRRFDFYLSVLEPCLKSMHSPAFCVFAPLQSTAALKTMLQVC